MVHEILSFFYYVLEYHLQVFIITFFIFTAFTWVLENFAFLIAPFILRLFLFPFALFKYYSKPCYLNQENIVLDYRVI